MRQASEETSQLRQNFSDLTTTTTIPTISNPVSLNRSVPVFIPKSTIAERQFDLRHKLNDKRIRRQRNLHTADYFVNAYFNEYNRDSRDNSCCYLQGSGSAGMDVSLPIVLPESSSAQIEANQQSSDGSGEHNETVGGGVSSKFNGYFFVDRSLENN